MDLNTFKEKLVTIDLQEDGKYAHYPFQLSAELPDGKLEICALMLGGDVEACYRKFIEYHRKGCPNIFMSIDFPAGDDIPNDFVVVLAKDNNKPSICAIPYDTATGERFPEIHSGERLGLIFANFYFMLMK